MIESMRVFVRPRVYVSGSRSSLALCDEIRGRLDDAWSGAIELSGDAGSGKSTALEYLREQFDGEPRLVLVDRPGERRCNELAVEAERRVVVYAKDEYSVAAPQLEQWRLAPWSRDEWIEYLLAAHHDQCSTVIARLQGDSHTGLLRGLPALLRPVLDALAGDAELTDVRTALRQIAAASLDSKWLCEARRRSFEQIGGRRKVSSVFKDLLLPPGDLLIALPLLRFDVVRLLLAADHFAECLADKRARAVLAEKHRPELLDETADVIAAREPVLQNLHDLLATGEVECHANAATLLIAAGVAWRPNPHRPPYLAGARLSDVDWSRIAIKHLTLTNADLSGADLHESQLSHVIADSALLENVSFRGAKLYDFKAVAACLAGAGFSHVRAFEPIFAGADLQGVMAREAIFIRADFTGADLREACFAKAALRVALFNGSRLAGANFSEADLSGADFDQCDLREVDLTGARLTHAHLQQANLEGLQLPEADLERAQLRGAYLTATEIPRGNFFKADLRETGLADIEWEGADLREADLRGATFHLGSSRSGLVDSTIASEGSRTGFYTDEYQEQEFKAPEEIRKANLCGADLRGANVEGVDFYLVDLRNAKYDDHQRDHFRRCRAILESRVP